MWELAKTYNVSVRFIATSSGLTRWHYIFDSTKNERVNEQGKRSKEYEHNVFGDIYSKSIEETWYKAAVLQHMINNESLVVATPLPILDDVIKTKSPVINDDGDITLTATYAIFYKDGNSSTPASVVGFQYSYLKFYERFLQITKEFTLDATEDPKCNSTKFDCFIIDSSGYIVLNEDKKLVGQFFGRVHKHVLQSFLDTGIFDHVEVFNYQALCPVSKLVNKNSSWSLRTPFMVTFNFLSWLITEALLLLSNVYNEKDYAYAYVTEEPDYNEIIKEAYTEAPTTTPPPIPQNESIPEKEKDEILFSCDHSVQLYILNQTYFLEAAGASPTVAKDEPGPCHPAYWASYIPKTNLLLVVIEKDDNIYEETCAEPRDTTPQPTNQSITSLEPCHKLELSRLTRRRLEGCFTYHDGERNITECGIASIARCDLLVALIAFCLLAYTKMITS